MTPLFKVGELVIRQAPETNYPEHNGEYIITEIITVEKYRKIYPNIIFNRLRSQLYYKLEGFAITFPDSGVVIYHTAEAFLKKKHKPADESFSQLMKSLKSKDKIGEVK